MLSGLAREEPAVVPTRRPNAGRSRRKQPYSLERTRDGPRTGWSVPHNAVFTASEQRELRLRIERVHVLDPHANRGEFTDREV